jgi:solute carrier family 12 (potassium/chloride transporters), member 9
MRNLVLNAGLGGLYPNLIVMGFFDLDDWRSLHPSSRLTSDYKKFLKRSTSLHTHHRVEMNLPTDDIRAERPIAITTWVNIVEDILLGLNMNIAIGKGMDELELPMLAHKGGWFRRRHWKSSKKYIDLWPIQMSAELTDDGGRRGSRVDDQKKNLVTSNFDTYTMIMQMVFPSN